MRQVEAQDKLYRAAGEIQFYSALLLKFYTQAVENRLHQQGAEISALEHGILNMLMHETLTISEISHRLGMDPSTLVRTVDRLEHQGLLKRGSDPEDRRRRPITITTKGRDLIIMVPSITSEDQTIKAFQSLGINPTIQLRDLLREVMNEFPEGKMIVKLLSNNSESVSELEP